MYASFVFMSSCIAESNATGGEDKQPKCNKAEHWGLHLQLLDNKRCDCILAVNHTRSN